MASFSKSVERLFAPRPPVEYQPPIDIPPESRATRSILGVALLLAQVAEYKLAVPYTPTEGAVQRQMRERRQRQHQLQRGMEEAVERWDPRNDPHVQGDPFKTLFVGRLAYSATEADLHRVFGASGAVERARVVRTPEGVSRGYGFVVYEREADCRQAFKESMGVRINDRPVLVDIERGRSDRHWRPRRLGGGLGGRHYTRGGRGRPAMAGRSDRGGRGGAPRRHEDRRAFPLRPRGGFHGPPMGVAPWQASRPQVPRLHPRDDRDARAGRDARFGGRQGGRERPSY